MDVKDYLQLTLRTDPDSAQYKAAAERATGCIRLDHAISGLVTEAGELEDILKRFKFYGKPIDIAHVKEEIGDTLWYLSLLLSELEWVIKEHNLGFRDSIAYPCENVPNIDLLTGPPSSHDIMEEIMTLNIDKLMARYPSKFSEENAVNRDLNKENQILGKEGPAVEDGNY